MKYKILFNRDKCIGTKSCLVSHLFSFYENDNKAQLSNNPRCTEIVIDLDEKQVEKLVLAAENCPVNVIGVLKETNDGYMPLVSTEITFNGAKVIHAYYDDLKEFVMDENGYFLIRILPETKEIEIGHCSKTNKIDIIIRGKNPREIYQTALKEGLITRMDHAAYLGKELQKAFDALSFGLKYVQDDELKKDG